MTSKLKSLIETLKDKRSEHGDRLDAASYLEDYEDDEASLRFAISASINRKTKTSLRLVATPSAGFGAERARSTVASTADFLHARGVLLTRSLRNATPFFLENWASITPRKTPVRVMRRDGVWQQISSSDEGVDCP